MNEHERPSPPATPESVWRSMDGKEGTSMDMTFTPDQLCAMARSRERESAWGWRLFLALLLGLAGAFVYNALSVDQLWTRLSQGWMLAWACLLVWRLRHGPGRMSATESCAGFLQREYENKRSGFLAFRRYLFLLIPPIAASWWGGGGLALRLSRLKALGVAPDSWLYDFARGPWLLLITGIALVLVWLAFGAAARKATRELEELRLRTRE